MAFTRDSIREDNICVIWVDDMIDVFTWRNAFGVTIQTPNIDMLLGAGVRFANTYATVPLCSPCRAEVATGISPYRSGLVDLNRLWREIMPPEKAWAYDLRRAGFYNFTTGKTDGHYNPMPERFRRILFHEEPRAYDIRKRTGIKRYMRKTGPGVYGVNHPNDDGSQDDRFYDYRVAQNAIEHLDRADPNRRHLIQFGFRHPHFNLDCPDRFYQMYDPRKIVWPSVAAPEDFTGPQPGMAVYELAYIVNGQWTPEQAGDEAWRQVVRAYFAACSHVDHEIGRFLDALAASPLGDRTTVVFLSDNGFNLGNHDSFHKMSQWDSAAHVPLGIWSPRMEKGRVVDLPISLHNLPMTIMDLAGLPRRPDWPSGQSLLPLIDESFGQFDETKSPVTSVFGTLSVRPAAPDLRHLRYFRYPNGEEHVYDLAADPGETTNLADSAPMDRLRDELVRNAAELGLDLSGAENPADGINAMMAVDGSIVLAGGARGADYWAYGADTAKIKASAAGGYDTLWYMAGPDDYVLHMPAHIQQIRIATVVARKEGGTDTKTLRVVAHPESPFRFETSERVEVHVVGSNGDDVMVGPKYGGATFHGGAGDDLLRSVARPGTKRNTFHGGLGNDTLIGGLGQRDILIGGSGDDVLQLLGGGGRIFAGPGNDDIRVSDGGAEIDAGPGRNTIELGAGTHRVTLGPGPNRIVAGPGAKRFTLERGATVALTGWDKEQRYVLKDWPAPVQQRVLEGGEVMIFAATSCLVVTDCPPGLDLLAQVESGDA
ncbi:sulfatase-like hydrolase/transferase [Paracoccus chinensis]|uniref:Arylsulfatase A n=1 Tax=Paracoccus chinensis TaxID=525640 RepID=A0A1G9HU67_9RHOB|nr:sulfatase-like hydrolase/transferase [Paracoccus chinensis]SDL16375.1 Arylsulfatase A [Paracoccus chinensis]